MEKRTILVKSSCFAPEFEMIISVPEDRDTEEYIDELLDGILNDDLHTTLNGTSLTEFHKKVGEVYVAIQKAAYVRLVMAAKTDKRSVR